MQQILPKHLLSRLAGQLARSRSRWIKTPLIRLFCLCFPVNLSEALSGNLGDYDSFNDFFTRRLKPDARPLAGKFCSPADGQIASLGKIEDGTLIQSKGVAYSRQRLLGSLDTQAFSQGSFITIYLAPHNYHRVHAAAAARLTKATYIPGKLFSVNQATAAAKPNLFAENERLVMLLEQEAGSYACVMVGAMLVAGIRPAWQEAAYRPGLQVESSMQMPVNQGEELGWFEMGSTVVLVFSEDVSFKVSEGDLIKMGEALCE